MLYDMIGRTDMMLRGSSELEEPIAIRPTSETVMYPCECDMLLRFPNV